MFATSAADDTCEYHLYMPASLPPWQRGWSRPQVKAEVFLLLFSLPRVLLPGA